MNLLSDQRLPPAPRPPSPKFLPGESRATCGIEGFKPFDTAAYCRKLYANADPRNLVPAQHECPKGEPERYTPADRIPSAHLHQNLHLVAEFRAQCYIVRFLTRCMQPCIMGDY